MPLPLLLRIGNQCRWNDDYDVFKVIASDDVDDPVKAILLPEYSFLIGEPLFAFDLWEYESV